MIVLSKEESVAGTSPKLPPAICSDLPVLGITGHRDSKLPREQNKRNALEHAVYYHMDCRLREGYGCFLTGLAGGTDYMLTVYLAKKRREFPDIKIFGIQPFPDYEIFFEQHYKNIALLDEMKQAVDDIIVLSGEYNKKESFYARNRFIARHSDAILAVCSSNTHSGSANTLRYAREFHVPYCRIEPNPKVLYIPKPEEWSMEHVTATGNIFKKRS